MAVVRYLRRVTLERESTHTEADSTYSIISDKGGQRWLQIDTYGSQDRAILGKKSQTVRFSPEAVLQLRRILDDEGL